MSYVDARKPAAKKLAPPDVVRRGRKPPPENESRRQRFLRIGTPRMATAIKSIRLLANLARGDYEWTGSDVSIMQDRLYREVDAVVKEFATHNAKEKKKIDFGFDDSVKEAHANPLAAH